MRIYVKLGQTVPGCVNFIVTLNINISTPIVRFSSSMMFTSLTIIFVPVSPSLNTFKFSVLFTITCRQVLDNYSPSLKGPRTADLPGVCSEVILYTSRPSFGEWGNTPTILYKITSMKELDEYYWKDNDFNKRRIIPHLHKVTSS